MHTIIIINRPECLSCNLKTIQLDAIYIRIIIELKLSCIVFELQDKLPVSKIEWDAFSFVARSLKQSEKNFKFNRCIGIFHGRSHKYIAYLLPWQPRCLHIFACIFSLPRQTYLVPKMV
jgi:hypothetical protein